MEAGIERLNCRETAKAPRRRPIRASGRVIAASLA
jgi:hypothetical protein